MPSRLAAALLATVCTLGLLAVVALCLALGWLLTWALGPSGLAVLALVGAITGGGWLWMHCYTEALRGLRSRAPR